jgi:uncharacterized membrane protein YphA (DoxX/SURF4 family)
VEQDRSTHQVARELSMFPVPSILQAVAWLLRVGLAAVFLYAGATKLLDLRGFEQSIIDYGILLPGTEMAVAISLVILEILVGAGVLFGMRGALPGMVGLLVMFIGVLSYGVWLGLDIECGCFGLGESHEPGTALVIDIGLLCCCGLLFTLQRVTGPRESDQRDDLE